MHSPALIKVSGVGVIVIGDRDHRAAVDSLSGKSAEFQMLCRAKAAAGVLRKGLDANV
jgi:hypothetical protein